MTPFSDQTLSRDLGYSTCHPCDPKHLHLSERTQILLRSARVLRRRRVLVLYSALFPRPLAAITSCHLAIDLRQSKTPAISKLMKIKENGDRSRSRSRESREFREFPRIPQSGVLESPRETP